MPDPAPPEFFRAVLNDLQMLSHWEAGAVLLAIAYLVLAIRQSLWCWPAALLSSGIFGVLMARAGLPMQALLQAFYVAMAVYGWWHWSRGGDGGNEARVVRWSLTRHAGIIICVLLAAVASAWVLEQQDAAAWPLVDSLVAWAAVAATWMVARKVLENWLYWFVIDVASAWLYLQQGLALTGLLFLGYLVLIVFGYRSWRRSWQQQHG